MSALSELFLYAQVVLGIGLVIFVHELGHYIAARLCGVRVETFSLGFGPPLATWKRGDTVFQIAAVPLGGFCRMAGEEIREGLREPRPDELPAKSVGQRFFIYSGGVLMNLAFGLVVFPLLFWSGVRFDRPVVRVVPGGPAWEAGVPDGSEIVAVNGRRIYEFAALFTEVALGDEESTYTVRVPADVQTTTGPDQDPEGEQLRTFRVTSERAEGMGLREIGVEHTVARDADGHPLLTVDETSPAAKLGIEHGASLLAIAGNEEDAGLDLLTRWNLAMSSPEPRPLELTIAVEGETRQVTVPARELADKTPALIGVGAMANIVGAVRGKEARDIGLRNGDRITSVDGRRILNPVDLRRALFSGEGPATFALEREGEPEEVTTRPLTADERRALADDIALRADLDSSFVTVRAGGPAERAGLRDGDRIVSIDGRSTSSWDDIKTQIKDVAGDKRPATVVVARTTGDGPAELDFQLQPERLPSYTYDLGLQRASYLYRSDGVFDAIGFGALASWNILRQSWLTLKRMLFNDVSPKNVGGIISIGAVSYHFAELGISKLFFFLCLLSINLAFLNVLPIPVLDGGHLAFLIIEKIKGSPVSARTLGYSQMVGVVLILTLMVYVTYNDLVRWVFPSR